jgi:phage head maturation protease
MIITSKEFRNRIIAKQSTSDCTVAKASEGFDLTDVSNVLAFVFSSKTIDLSGDRVFPAGVDTTNYMARNPLILLHHDIHSFPVGKTLSLDVVGDQLIGRVQFFTDIEDAGVGANARAAMELIKRGTMGVSISFIPREFELNSTDGVDFTQSYMIETSVCTVPACPEAYLIPDPVAPISNSVSLNAIRQRLAAMRSRSLALTN